MENTKILIVDDDDKLRELLSRYLTQQSFTVETLANAKDIDRKLLRNRPDLIVLDIMMPGEDGLTVVKRLRQDGENIPIVMLTACGEDVDRIVGLENGADDYLSKPFNPRELTARIQAVLRRHNSTPELHATYQANDSVNFGEFCLHLGRRELICQDKHITLTSAEYAVLSVLATHPRRPLTREQLMEMALGKSNNISLDRSIDVHVSRLRKALQNKENDVRHIQTVWGYGYVFVPDGKLQE